MPRFGLGCIQITALEVILIDVVSQAERMTVASKCTGKENGSMKDAPMTQYEPIQKCHLAGIVNLCKTEDWPSYTENPGTTWRALTAPGVCTVVAFEGKEVVGFVQMQSDGVIQAHISVILVAQNYRRRGIGRRLVEEAFRRCGGKRVDLITMNGADDSYRSFKRQCCSGYRIYPQIQT